MTTRAHRRQLVDHLRGWSPEQVAILLRRRPDLAQPQPPADVAELAQRAQYRPSIDTAVGASTLPENRLLQIVVCCRPDVPLDELAGALPDGIGLDDVAGLLSSLEEAALVWRHRGRLHCSVTLRQAMPTTLGPPVQVLAGDHTVDYLKAVLVQLRAEVADADFPGTVPPRAIGPGGRPPRKAELIEELASLLASPGVVVRVLAASPEAAAIAIAMADGRPMIHIDHPLYYSGYSNYYQRFPTYWLFERALLLPVGDGRTGAQPREVGVALRGGRPVHDLALDQPALAAAPVRPAEVDARAAVRAAQTLDRLADLLERWEQAPAKALKNGGLGAMVMKQTAAALEVDAEEASRLVELAHLAGLVNSTTVTTKERRTYVHQAYVGPTPPGRAWAAQSFPRRYRRLATAWLRAEHWPSASGRKVPEGKVVPVMSVQYAATSAPDLRRRVLETLASLDPGAATTPSTLAACVYWERPQPWLGLDLGLGLGAEDPATVIGWVFAEAELLGVVADGSLSSFGRAVLEGRRGPAEEALAVALPVPVTTFVLQADLTATVVGALDRGVLSELRLLADVESTGAATTLRFSDASLRRALDAGRDGDAIMAFLADHATKGVPKPLAYLVGDVARRHGHLQVGPAGSYVTSADPAVLADACSHRRTRKLGLRLLAPTVAVSPQPSAKVLAGLREAGFLPTPEGGEGPGEDADHRARASHAALIAIHEAFNPARSRGPDGDDAARAGPDADPDAGVDAELPEPYRSRTRSQSRPAPPLGERRAATLAQAILAGPPEDLPSDQLAETDPVSAPRRTGRGGEASRRPASSVPLPMAFPHDPVDEDDAVHDDAASWVDEATWADPILRGGGPTGEEDEDEPPEGLDELLKWAVEHRRVLGIRVADGEDLGEPILFAVTGWRPDLLLGTDLADGAAVSIMPQDIGAVTDLGPLDELDNVALLGDARSRPHRRRSSRGRRR